MCVVLNLHIAWIVIYIYFIVIRNNTTTVGKLVVSLANCGRVVVIFVNICILNMLIAHT